MSETLTVEKFEYIPGRIEAAMRYVEHCRTLTEAINCCGGSTQGRELTASERAAYEAALGAMRLYFAGEMDFGGAPMRLPEGCEQEARTEDAKRGKRRKHRKKE
jgi:hypothetical protein